MMLPLLLALPASVPAQEAGLAEKSYISDEEKEAIDRYILEAPIIFFGRLVAIQQAPPAGQIQIDRTMLKLRDIQVLRGDLPEDVVFVLKRSEERLQIAKGQKTIFFSMTGSEPVKKSTKPGFFDRIREKMNIKTPADKDVQIHYAFPVNRISANYFKERVNPDVRYRNDYEAGPEEKDEHHEDATA